MRDAYELPRSIRHPVTIEHNDFFLAPSLHNVNTTQH